MNEHAAKSIRKIQEQLRQQLSAVGKTPDLERKLCVAVTEAFDSVRQNVNAPQEPTTILPLNCRFFKQSSKGGALFVEYPPMRRTVFVGGRGRSYNLPFPYFQFFAGYISSRQPILNNTQIRPTILSIGATTSPLSSEKDTWYNFPLCHTNGLHQMCIPLQRPHYDSVVDLMNTFIETFWSSSFIYEFVPFLANRKYINSWSEWSELNVTDMLNIELPPIDTVKNTIERFTPPDVNPFHAIIGQTESNIHQAIRNAIKRQE